VLGGPEAPDELRVLLQQRFAHARRLREEVLGRHHHTDVYRLINAEGDGLSGQETTAREGRYLKVALLHGE